MQYSERLPAPLPTKTLVTPLVALLIGAAAATGAYALIDNGDERQPSNVIVVERPAPAGDGVAAKDEAGSGTDVYTSHEALLLVGRIGGPHGLDQQPVELR